MTHMLMSLAGGRLVLVLEVSLRINLWLLSEYKVICCFYVAMSKVAVYVLLLYRADTI